MMIEIPNEKNLEIRTIICDYNGTIAKDGNVLLSIKLLFEKLAENYKIYVITADTFGSVKAQLDTYPCEIKILSSDNHTNEKADFIKNLGAKHCIALGNGNNDALMLKTAEIGIAILGDEGCSKETLLTSDILCKNIEDGLELLVFPKRLVATLRR